MKNIILIFFLIIFSSPLLFAPLAFANDRPSNEMPMYGGKHSPTVEQNKQLSIDAAKKGWEYYYKGDLDTAIKRFNQAWMFDRNNPDAYWGFGLIMGHRSSIEDPEFNLKESIRLLGMAFELDSKNGRILGDKAFSHTILGHFLKLENKSYEAQFSEAEKNFEKAFELDPEYPPTFYNWAILKFYKEDYKSSKDLMEQAQTLGLDPNPAFAKELNEKLK